MICSTVGDLDMYYNIHFVCVCICIICLVFYMCRRHFLGFFLLWVYGYPLVL